MKKVTTVIAVLATLMIGTTVSFAGNSSSVVQDGVYNSSRTSQTGRNNYSEKYQSGYRNRSRTRQTGRNNTSNIGQFGHHNSETTTQRRNRRRCGYRRCR